MQSLASRVWSHRSRWHVGDLAWNRHPRTAVAEWPTLLWERDGLTYAWGWAQLPSHLDLLVDPAWPELAGSVVDWFEELASGQVRTCTVLEPEEHLVTALHERGYSEARESPFWLHMSHALENLPPVRLPAGFTARSLRGESEAPARARLHRAAWEDLPFAAGSRKVTSRVTEARYRDLLRVSPYRAELDFVIESPGGELAAYANVWYDETQRVGELEPVGTDPRHRRLGLAGAVCLHGLHALRALGAREAIVYPRGDAEYPVPAQLYRRLGFAPYARTRTYVNRD